MIKQDIRDQWRVCTVVGEASISRVALSRNACSVSSFLTIDRLINRRNPTQIFLLLSCPEARAKPAGF
jgi:hypothetical protein